MAEYRANHAVRKRPASREKVQLECESGFTWSCPAGSTKQGSKGRIHAITPTTRLSPILVSPCLQCSSTLLPLPVQHDPASQLTWVPAAGARGHHAQVAVGRRTEIMNGNDRGGRSSARIDEESQDRGVAAGLEIGTRACLYQGL